MNVDHFKGARRHFKVTSDFPYFSDKDPDARDVGGRGLLKDLPQIIQLEKVQLGFELRSA